MWGDSRDTVAWAVGHMWGLGVDRLSCRVCVGVGCGGVLGILGLELSGVCGLGCGGGEVKEAGQT